VELGRDLRVLVFDLDGTLVHLDVDWTYLRRRLGPLAPAESLGAAIQRLVTASSPVLAEVTSAELAALGDRRVDPDIAVTLEKLAGRYRLAVFTRNSREVAQRALAGLDLGPGAVIVGREDCARLKPAPDGLRRIMDHFRVTAAEVAVIGDTSHDVEAAAAVGAVSVVVRNDRLAHAPGGADHRVDRLSDLLTLFG